MELRNNMELELKENLDCGVKVLEKATKFKVTKIENEKVYLSNSSIGVGVFSSQEIDEYFMEFSNKINSEIKKVIKNGKATIVILSSGVKGVAKCLEEDTYNEETGIRIAYLKAKIKEMTKELKRY